MHVTSKQQKLWPVFNLLWSGINGLVIASLELTNMVLLLNFIQTSYGDEARSSKIIGAYFGIFIYSMFFQFFGSCEAYIQNNTLQVVAVAIFNLLAVLYSIIQVYQTNQYYACAKRFQNFSKDDDILQLYKSCYFATPTDVTTIPTSVNLVANHIDDFTSIFRLQYTILALMIFFNIIGFYISYKVYKEYGWNNFLLQGAGIKKKQMNVRYQIFIILLKFNIFFFSGIITQYVMAIYFANGPNLGWLWVLCVTVFTSIAFYLLGHYGMRHASKYLVLLFLLVMILNLSGTCYIISVAFTSTTFYPTRIWLVGFSCFQILLIVVTILNTVMLYRDFDHGFAKLFVPIDASDIQPVRVTLD